MNPIVADLENGLQRQKEDREKRPQTTEQLSVFRAAANALYILTRTVSMAPRKTMRFCDKATADAAEMLKCISLANILTGEDRIYYLQVAEANAVTIRAYTKIPQSLGAMSGKEANAFKKLMKSVTSQLAGWRAFTRESLKSEDNERAQTHP